ncbi:AMP-dependent synthetase/ligase [Streptomyces sp. 8L]|uniref:AMP-dependent synthetase/ligase n=1 Tax=Streptomyces sp. 8L TaxID=2877242 RepID=UPI001CD4D3D4|nr:AMP-dependent synthetase/ligase [Streptomyces sp. 8L]MCA1222741.1 AMP-dependent synthetase/ligase [Streptomyces sp. 8L]
MVMPDVVRSGGAVREASVPPLVPAPRGGSLADIPYENVRRAPDAVVISRKLPDGSWQDMTAAAFAEDVGTLARGLVAEGLMPGDRIAIMARTSYAWTVLDFAAWAAGLVTVPVYPTSSAFQTRWILQDSGAIACVVQDAAQAALVRQERRQLSQLTHLWELHDGGLDRLREAGAGVGPDVLAERRGALTPDSLATLSYTSGTTGRPKGCALTHGNFFAEVDNAISLLYPLFMADSKEPASILLFLPLSHIFGRMVSIACLRARVRLGHAPSVETEALLSDLAAFRPTFLLAIPYVLEKVYNTARAKAERMGRASSFDRAARVARRYGEALEAAEHGTGPGPSALLRTTRALYDPLVHRRIRTALGGRVKYAICGGSPLGRRLASFYAGVGVEIFEGYGLTETTAAATCTPPRRPRMGTVGWPIPGTAVRIADDGEILLRGGHVFAGYWDAERGVPVPEHDRDGWFATGDLGALDDEGYLTITGRKKDVIITTGGKSVAPAPLEDWLRAHPLISQCMVTGDNRPYITALLTLDPDGLAHWREMRRKRAAPTGPEAEEEDLRVVLQRAVDEVNRLVSRAESIRRFLVLTTDFTERNGHLTPSRKLRRDEITRDFADEIAKMYER